MSDSITVTIEDASDTINVAFGNAVPINSSGIAALETKVDKNGGSEDELSVWDADGNITGSSLLTFDSTTGLALKRDLNLGELSVPGHIHFADGAGGSGVEIDCDPDDGLIIGGAVETLGLKINSFTVPPVQHISLTSVEYAISPLWTFTGGIDVQAVVKNEHTATFFLIAPGGYAWSNGVTELPLRAGASITLLKREVGVDIVEILSSVDNPIEFQPTSYGATGDGTTNDRAAIVAADADAALYGGVVEFLPGAYKVNTNYTIACSTKFAVGATLKPASGVTITVTNTIDAGPYPIFDLSLGGVVKLSTQTNRRVYPEWWGAKPMASPQDTAFDADTIDCAPAFNAITTAFTNGSFNGVTIELSGWYAVGSEIHFAGTRVTPHIKGTNPMFGGTGLRWVGTPDATKSILHFTGCEFATVENVGFYAPRMVQETNRCLAAIRISSLSGYLTQRGITIQSVVIGDPFGFFADSADGHSFSAGILEGGPSSQNANDDFCTIENAFVAQCKDGIRVEHNQAVEWQIRNYRAIYCDCLYTSTDGGQFYGIGWYAASATFDVMIKNTSNQLLTFELIGLSSEHQHSNGLLRSIAGSVRATISGNLIQKTTWQRHKVVSVTGNVATSTAMFFTEGMEGQKLTWRTGADAGVKTAIIDEVTSPTTANVTTTPADSTIASGETTATQANGVNEFRIVDCSAGIVSVDFKNIQFSTSPYAGPEYYGVYQTADTRLTFYFGASNALKVRSISFTNCWEAFSPYLYDDGDGSHNAIIDFAWFGCSDSVGSGYPATMNYRYTRSDTDAADLVALTEFQLDSSIGNTDAIEYGQKRGGLSHRIKTQTHRVLTNSSNRLYVDAFFKPNRLYHACSFYTPPGFGNEVPLGGNIYAVIKIGTPEFPELFGRANYSTSEYISRIETEYQMPVSFSDDTPLQITLVYSSYIQNYTITQTNDVVTSSGSAFQESDVGRRLEWTTGLNAGESVYIVEYTSGTSVKVTGGNVTRAAGLFEIERDMVAGGFFLLQPAWTEALPKPKEFMITYFQAIDAETNAAFNLAEHTEEFDDAYWDQTTDVGFSDAGDLVYTTAQTMIPTNTRSWYHSFQKQFSGLKNTTVYTYSIYVKANGYEHIMMIGMDGTSGRFFKIGGGSEGQGAVFGTAPLASGIKSMGGNWWRCWVASATDAVFGSGYCGVYACETDGIAFFAANGTDGVDIAQFQLTEGYGMQEYGTTYNTGFPNTRIGNKGSTVFKSSSPTVGIGYSQGAGGRVTQATSRTTGVTCNTVTGAITLVSAAGSATAASFTVTNSSVLIGDTVTVNQQSGTDLYVISVTAVANGSFRITSHTTGGTTTEQPVFNFNVTKGARS